MMDTKYQSEFGIYGSSLVSNEMPFNDQGLYKIHSTSSGVVVNFDDFPIFKGALKALKSVREHKNHQNIYSAFEVDFSSVNPLFRPKNDTFLQKKFADSRILEDELDDAIVLMRPKKTHSINLKIKTRKKAKPFFSGPDIVLDSED